ncbi:hypothetical protein ACSNOD_22845, partial [Streptomyces sp. URMC 123]
HGGDPDGAWHVLETAADLARELDDDETLTKVALTFYGLHGSEAEGAPGRLTAELLAEAHRRVVAPVGPPERGPGPGHDRAEAPARGRAEVDLLARELAARAAVLARTEWDDETLGFSLWARHDAIWGLGTAEERVALTEELIGIARRAADGDLEHFAASFRWVALLELGDPRYFDQYEAALAGAERHGLPRVAFASLIDRSIVATLMGRYAEAEELLDRFCAMPPRYEYAGHSSMVGQLRWSLWLAQGRHEELGGGPAGAGPIGDDHPCPGLMAAIAALHRGEPEAALRYHAEITEGTVRTGQGPVPRDERFPRVCVPLWLRFQAQLAAATGDPGLCERARAALTPYAGQWLVALYGCDISGPVDLWTARLDLAQGRWPDAVGRFTAARDSADRLRARPWSVEARAGLAEALIRRGAPGDATTAAELLDGVERDAAALAMRHVPPIVERLRTTRGPGGPTRPGTTPVRGHAARAGTTENAPTPEAAPAREGAAGDNPAWHAPAGEDMAPEHAAGAAPLREGTMADSPAGDERSAQGRPAGASILREHPAGEASTRQGPTPEHPAGAGPVRGRTVGEHPAPHSPAGESTAPEHPAAAAPLREGTTADSPAGDERSAQERPAGASVLRGRLAGEASRRQGPTPEHPAGAVPLREGDTDDGPAGDERSAQERPAGASVLRGRLAGEAPTRQGTMPEHPAGAGPARGRTVGEHPAPHSPAGEGPTDDSPAGDEPSAWARPVPGRTMENDPAPERPAGNKLLPGHPAGDVPVWERAAGEGPAWKDPAGTSPSEGRPVHAAGERSAQERPVPGRTMAYDPAPERPAGDAHAAVFRREGDVWRLSYAGRTVHLPDAKGLRDLRVLLSRPGTDVPAVRLLDPAGGDTVVAARSAGGDPVLDDEAKARYRRRLESLDEEIDRAAAGGDDERAAAYDRERAALLRELRAATGLGGRSRRLGDEAERARKTVTARIRDALRRLETRHPELAAHLRASVSTGSSCGYHPVGPRPPWSL